MTKLIILDFDQTITIAHTGGAQRKTTLARPGYIQSNIRPGIADFILKHLALGNKIAIASFVDAEEHGEGKAYLSGEELIKCYLNEIAPHAINQISIIAHYPISDEPLNKNLHIEKLKTQHKLSDAILYDDREENVIAAKEKGHAATLVPLYSENNEFWTEQANLLPSIPKSSLSFLSFSKATSESKVAAPISVDDVRAAMQKKVTELSQEIKDTDNSCFSCLFNHNDRRKAQRGALNSLLKLYWENLTPEKVDAVIEKYNVELVHKNSSIRSLIESLKNQLDSAPYAEEKYSESSSFLSTKFNSSSD